MASEVDVSNQALSLIGSDAVVTAINPPDGSVESGHCARFLPIARRAMIEMATPSWAKRRRSLTPVTNPSSVWLYAYALPSECIKPLRVLQSAAFSGYLPNAGIFDDWAESVDVLINEQGSSAFEMETDEAGSLVLLTNEPEAVALYLRDVKDPAKWTPAFQSAMGYMLASYLAGPIIKGMEGIRVARAMRDLATAEGTAAAVSNANSSSEPHGFLPSALAARR